MLAAVQVYIVHRRDEFRASKVMQKRALEHEKIKVSQAAQSTGVLTLWLGVQRSCQGRAGECKGL